MGIKYTYIIIHVYTIFTQSNYQSRSSPITPPQRSVRVYGDGGGWRGWRIRENVSSKRKEDEPPSLSSGPHEHGPNVRQETFSSQNAHTGGPRTLPSQPVSDTLDIVRKPLRVGVGVTGSFPRRLQAKTVVGRPEGLRDSSPGELGDEPRLLLDLSAFVEN